MWTVVNWKPCFIKARWKDRSVDFCCICFILLVKVESRNHLIFAYTVHVILQQMGTGWSLRFCLCTPYMLLCTEWGLSLHFCLSVCFTCCWTLLLWLMLGASIKEGEKVCRFSLTLFISINCAGWEMVMQLSLRVCTLSHSSGSCTRSSRVIIT